MVAVAGGLIATLSAEDLAGTPHPPLVVVPAGPFIAGSDSAEREFAYKLDEAAYGHSRTRERGWYDSETDASAQKADSFLIMSTPVTNAEYAAFVNATGHRAPDVDEVTWKSYRLIHPYSRTRRHAWQDGQPPEDRDDHPVVLVSYADAQTYANWLSERTDRHFRLPEAAEWEKAARGTDGQVFPWGNDYDPARLNSHDLGPFDTSPVGAYPTGVSPYGMLDAAGQVFEWTATGAGNRRHFVKGGSWDDKGCGICRPAARHSRPDDIKHILVGFRLIDDGGR